MKEWHEFYDFGHWGIMTDEDTFYPEVLERLKYDLASGKDFDSGWGTFKHELQSMRIQGDGDEITVSVSCYMDDPEDFVYDSDLTEEECKYVMELWCNNPEAITEVIDKAKVSRAASVKEILKKAADILVGCEQRIEDSYEFLQGCISDTINSREGKSHDDHTK